MASTICVNVLSFVTTNNVARCSKEIKIADLGVCLLKFVRQSFVYASRHFCLVRIFKKAMVPDLFKKIGSEQNILECKIQ